MASAHSSVISNNTESKILEVKSMTKRPYSNHLPQQLSRFVLTFTMTLSGPLFADNIEVPTKASIPLTSSNSLEKAELNLSKGSFESAALDLKPLLIDDSSLSKAERARLYILKSRIDLAFGTEANLDIWLGRALKADPALFLDPLKDPPALVARWTELKRHSQKSTAEEALRTKVTTPPTEVAGVDSRGKSFAGGMLPLGISQFNADRRKDGALFLSLNIIPLLVAKDLPTPLPGSSVWTTPRRPEFFTGTLMMGVYGFQLLDMAPELFDRNPDAAQAVYAGLSIAPFGVGQLRNGEPFKAIVFGGIESAALVVAAFSPNEQHSGTATAVFAGAVVLGAVDATIGYRKMDPVRKTSSEFSIFPLFTDNKIMGLEVNFKFK